MNSPAPATPLWCNPIIYRCRHGWWRRHQRQPGPRAFGPRSKSLTASPGCLPNRPPRSTLADWARVSDISVLTRCAASTPRYGLSWVSSALDIRWMIITTWAYVTSWLGYMVNMVVNLPDRFGSSVFGVTGWWVFDICYMTPFLTLPWLYAIDRRRWSRC